MHATDEPYCYIENLSSENIEKCKSENGLLSKLENVFVASFSYDKENNNNKYMWNYYSDGLNGFCLEFDKDEIIKKVLSQFDGFAVSSGEVKYYPIKECLDAVGADNDSELSAENIDKFLMRKSLLWAKEKEYRIVISKKQMQGTIKCGRWLVV